MSGATAPTEVATPHGPGRLHLDLPAADTRPAVVVLLGHGAGNGIDTRDLETLAAALPAGGVAVARFEIGRAHV